MTAQQALPLLILLSSLLPGIIIFFLPERRRRWRTGLNLGGATLKVILVAVLILGVAAGERYEFGFDILPGVQLVLRVDALSLLFAALSAVLWFVTTVYAIGYLEGSPHRSRFFGFFSICVSATIGIALAGNLLTFVIFYELLTLSTYPLVVHRGTAESRRAGRVYLAYTISGGSVLLLATVWFSTLVGPVDFTAAGVLAGRDDLDPATLIVIFYLFVVGLGVKAALVPLHGWLPVAMVAPAPVSALLHAVAVVKAGAFGIIRVVYDVYGVEFARDLGVLEPLAAVAALTIIYGSVRALYQKEVKPRLAYSTISQVSYIVLGVAIAGPVATIGGVAHLVHQGLMKITLFFCAGNLAETLGIHRIEQMDGVGRRMPLTMFAFTLGALGMIGVPPLAGFISKWYLGIGSAAVGDYWVIGVLLASTVLNAAYFLPLIYAAWFRPPRAPWPAERHRGRYETAVMLLMPALLTATLSLAVGVLAQMPFSPLAWTRLLTAREYGGM